MSLSVVEKTVTYPFLCVHLHNVGCIGLFQRDTIQASSNFAHRNQLPVRLQEQMLAHLCLKFRTDLEGLQQQETVDALPKAIRSSIALHLFYSLVDRTYLFNGVSTDLIFQLVKISNSILNFFLTVHACVNTTIWIKVNNIKKKGVEISTSLSFVEPRSQQ